MFPDEDYIDFKYRKWLFACQSRVPDIVNGFGGHCYQLECPLCGAPKSHLKWMPHKRTWKFICSTRSKRNCQSQLEFPVLLKVWNPDLFLTINRSDLTLDQQVLDSTVQDHQSSVRRGGSWIFRSVRCVKTNRNPLASAPHREIWVLTVVVSCSDAP